MLNGDLHWLLMPLATMTRFSCHQSEPRPNVSNTAAVHTAEGEKRARDRRGKGAEPHYGSGQEAGSAMI